MRPGPDPLLSRGVAVGLALTGAIALIFVLLVGWLNGVDRGYQREADRHVECVMDPGRVVCPEP